MTAAKKILHHPDFISDSERKKLAKMVLRLFDLWQLDTVSQLTLLDLSPTSRALLSRYREGKSPLPYTQDMLDRVGWLLVIHHALRSLYTDTSICYQWVHLPQSAFENISPLIYMKQHGLIGIAKIARYLQLQLTT